MKRKYLEKHFQEVRNILKTLPGKNYNPLAVAAEPLHCLIPL